MLNSGTLFFSELYHIAKEVKSEFSYIKLLKKGLVCKINDADKYVKIKKKRKIIIEKLDDGFERKIRAYNIPLFPKIPSVLIKYILSFLCEWCEIKLWMTVCKSFYYTFHSFKFKISNTYEFKDKIYTCQQCEFENRILYPLEIHRCRFCGGMNMILESFKAIDIIFYDLV
jgi:hypothetical protein